MTDEWISIKDRLPETRNPVLIYGKVTCGTCFKEPIVRQGRFREGRFEFGEYDCGCDVTHWMPLPEPPKD